MFERQDAATVKRRIEARYRARCAHCIREDKRTLIEVLTETVSEIAAPYTAAKERNDETQADADH